MIDKSLIKHTKRIYVLSQSADPSPPLGTVLGNLGVNTSSFCNGFNTYTKELPNYFLLSTTIYILENRTTSFVVNLPNIGYILSLLKYNKIIKVLVNDRNKEKNVSCVNIYHLLKLSKLKFPYLPLKKSLSMVLGTVKSMNLTIIFRDSQVHEFDNYILILAFCRCCLDFFINKKICIDNDINAIL